MIHYTDQDRNLIPALTIALEARGEKDRGQRAIGEVLRHRAARTGRTTTDEALRPKAFSAWNNNSLENAQKIITPEEYQRAAKNWFGSEDTNEVPGSTHYFNPKLSNPKWDFTKMQKINSIGNHEFYNEPAWGQRSIGRSLQKNNLKTA